MEDSVLRGPSPSLRAAALVHAPRSESNDQSEALRATFVGKMALVAPTTSPSVPVVSSDTPALAMARSTGTVSGDSDDGMSTS